MSSRVQLQPRVLVSVVEASLSARSAASTTASPISAYVEVEIPTFAQTRRTQAVPHTATPNWEHDQPDKSALMFAFPRTDDRISPATLSVVIRFAVYDEARVDAAGRRICYGKVDYRVAQLETENERLQLILVAPGQQRGGGDADGSDALPKKEEWSLLAADLHAELAIEAAIHRAGPSDAAMALRALIEASRTVARPESSDDAMGEVTTTGLLSIEDQTRKVETMRVATEEAERVLEDAVVAHRRLVLGGDDARRAQRDVLERELHRMTDALNGGGVRGSGDPVCL